MNVPLGAACIAAGSCLGLWISLVVWPRLAAVAGLGAMGVAGVLVGAGALLVQDHVGALEWALTLVTLGVLAPAHSRILLGRPGTRR